MAFNNQAFSTILFSFILAIFTAEATIANPPQAQNVSAAQSPASPECPAEYIKFHLNGTTEKTKQFLRDNIEKRLHDTSFGQAEKECLMRCFQAYHAAVASIEKAAPDVSENKFSDAIVDVVAYSSFIGSTMKMQCSGSVTTRSADFTGMQRWAEASAGDLLKKLKICAK